LVESGWWNDISNRVERFTWGFRNGSFV
jgi:hypothetical protein